MRKWEVYLKPCGELAVVEWSEKWHKDAIVCIDDKENQWFSFLKDFSRMIRGKWERLGEL